MNEEFANPNPTVFCVNCGKMVEYDTETAKVDLNVRNISFRYDELMAFCKECGEEVYVARYNDINGATREKAFKDEVARKNTTKEVYGIS